MIAHLYSFNWLDFIVKRVTAVDPSIYTFVSILYRLALLLSARSIRETTVILLLLWEDEVFDQVSFQSLMIILELFK
jgi:hypothetical protein